MNMFRLMSAGLIVAATLTTPAMARDKKPGMRNAENAYESTQSHKQRCAARAPDEGAYAGAPYRKSPCEPVGWTH